MEEVWRDVVGYEDRFKVSNLGRVFSKATNRILKQFINESGYMVFSTKIGGRDGEHVCFRVHRLVAEAFLGPPSEELQAVSDSTFYKKVPVNHKDGNKQNNCADNLEWVTHSDNSRHAVEKGLLVNKAGIEHPSSCLNKEQVEYIRDNYKPYCKVNGASALAKKYNVHRKTIRECAKGITYRD